MNLTKLHSNNAQVVDDYVREKFKRFSRFTYSRATRVKKCEEYYIAARGSQYGEEAVERIYQQVFKQFLDTDHAESRAAAKVKPEKVLVESSMWLSTKQAQGEQVGNSLAKLRRWKENGDYQYGESFFSGLVAEVAYIDDSICDAMGFQTEFSAECQARITHDVVIGKKEIEAQYDLMVGFKQDAACKFEARVGDWGVINAKLEESFKAGIWSSGSAKANMGKLGFTVDVQAAIAMGAQLNIEGELAWTKGRGKLALGGEAELFVGARADASATLSVNARKGIDLALKAGAFAGFSAEATGTCSFSYDGKTIASASATAGVTFGVGAEFEASIKAPIFGPTAIACAGNLTVGLGTKIDTRIAFNFSEAALASSAAFKKLVYLRTMARGYEMTLMQSDARNLYYLNKAIARLEAELTSSDELIDSFQRVPEEKRKLLVAL